MLMSKNTTGILFGPIFFIYHHSHCFFVVFFVFIINYDPVQLNIKNSKIKKQLFWLQSKTVMSIHSNNIF